jgi:hypothetical protein
VVAAAEGAVKAAVLGARALNRALLERQKLARRADLSVAEALEHLVGLQAQATSAPYLALWSRLRGFRIDDLSRAIAERRAVRLALMRSTIHLVTARDCLALRPVLGPALRRSLETASPFGRKLVGVDMDALAAAGRALVEAEPRLLSEVGLLLAKRWRRRDPAALGQALRAHLALVQVPPRGIWGVGGAARHTTAEAWLGRRLAAGTAPDAMILRYLAAFGPASARDVQVWSGLGPAAVVNGALERLRPRLRLLHDERGALLFDVPGAPLPDEAAPAPPRFLPDYDNVLLSHADRSRIVADGDRRRIFGENAARPSVLVDGFVRATWKIARARGSATLVITPFRRLSKPERAAVAEEGARLLSFAAADAARHEVRI